MHNIAIQVGVLKKSYKKLHVLKCVNFKVEQGTIFALLGSNSAGKTAEPPDWTLRQKPKVHGSL